MIDDVISTGSSIAAGLQLLAVAGVEPIAIGAAMLQSDRWRERLAGLDTDWTGRTVGVLRAPMLRRRDSGGWMPS